MILVNFYSSVFLFVIFSSLQLNAQEDYISHEAEHHYKHRLALFTGYGLIPGSINKDGKKQLEVIPVLGFNYEYFINHKISVGLFNDVELTSYSIKNLNGDYLEREYALVTAAVFLYEPISELTLFAGPGYEFEKPRICNI